MSRKREDGKQRLACKTKMKITAVDAVLLVSCVQLL